MEQLGLIRPVQWTNAFLIYATTSIRVTVLLVPWSLVQYSYLVLFRERTIIQSVSYWNRYWVYHIESHHLLLYWGKPDITCITAGSADVNGSH